MQSLLSPRPQLYRVWITRFAHWQPQCWSDVPPHCVALEPAEERCLSAADAALYLETYNRAALAHLRNRWAVAVPVAMRYDGDLLPGQRLVARKPLG